jgi:hypothetical protein
MVSFQEKERPPLRVAYNCLYYKGSGMHIDPIQLGAMVAYIINAWLYSRRK